MNDLTTAYLIRRSKILVVLMAALFGITTLTNNITDYAAYTDYIGKILSMTNTEGNESRRYRAITSSFFHHRFYWAIITLETMFTIGLLVGIYQLSRKRNTSGSEFNEAKKFAIAGLTLALFTYQIFYSVILNEWFDMDFTSRPNGYEWARNNIEYMFFGLIYLVATKD
jgi:predicted small integral membrane protein